MGTPSSRALFAQITRGSPSSMLLVAADGVIAEVNPAAMRELGAKPGDSLWTVLDGDDAARELLRVWAASDGGVAGTLSRGEGWRQVTGWRLGEAADLVVLQVTELSHRPQDQFLSMLGHELRNPLAPIQTALDLMRTKAPETFQREREVIQRQARQLTLMVDDILDVNRIAAGRIELSRRRGALADAVRHAVERMALVMERRGHHLVVDLGEPVELDADHDRLIQVFAHLLDNAAKYTDRGGQLRIAVVRGDGAVEVHVHDNGRGIPAPLLARIFEPFVQDERTGARAPGGLGLGLAIVRGITRLHGGSVTAHSDGPGTGSTFVVRLPLPAVAVPVVATAGAVRLSKVLVVDDNVDAATLLADGLASLGHQARVAADGHTALELVESMAPDVALIDLGMPVMDGFELSRRLRSLPRLGRMRHIALTGYSALRDRLDSDAAGFDAHLVKPVTLEQVARAIAALAANDDENR